MRYMVLSHVNKLEHFGLWYVADMQHPELPGKIILKSLNVAMGYCERMNRGERFWDCHGRETLHDVMVRYYEAAGRMSEKCWFRVHHQAVDYFEVEGNRRRRAIRV